MSGKFERRFATELRAGKEEATGAKYIQGYASVFGQESTDDGLGFREMVMPGAFARSLREGRDVKALFNHDPNRVLGRVKNGTLQLREDSRGLHFRAVLDPNNSEHMNMHAAISRGDIDECSFGFIAQSQEWNDVRDKDGNLYAQRKLHDVDLMDVSAVTYPAYGNTSVTARCAVMFPDGDQEVRSAIAALTEKRGGPKPADSDDKIASKSGVLSNDAIKVFTDAFNDKYKECAASGMHEKESYAKARDCAFKAIEDMVAMSPAKVIDGSSGAEGNDVPGEQADDDNDERKKLIEMEKRGEHKGGSIGKRDAMDGMDDHDCDDPSCWCQNRMVDPLDVWADEDMDEDDIDEDLRATKRAARKAAAEVESRAGKKARTKSVGGKNLPASAFAYVGDPERTETWKLPIHDAAHVRNALARFNQTQGIPSSAKSKVYGKIKAAAKKFGIHVSEENFSHVDAETAAATVRLHVVQTDIKHGI